MRTLILISLLSAELFAQSNSLQRFDTISLGGGRLTLTVTSSISSSFRNYYSLYPIEVSSNLSQWTPWVTLVRTNSSTNQTQAAVAASSSSQFYRTPTNSLITAIPPPGGNFTVGTTTRIFTDTTRSNRYNIKNNSSFVVQFWYPADARVGAWPASYVEPQIAATLAGFYSSAGQPINSALLKSSLSHSLPDVPVMRDDKYPIIIFVHGYQCTRTMDTDVMEHLASQGYITLAADHFDAWATLLPGERIAKGNAPELPITVSQNIFNLESRKRDLHFILDELERLQSHDELFHDTLDLEHIGIFGHSLGGAIAADVSASENRVKAGLSLDGGGHTNLLALDIKIPFLIASGDDDNPVMPPYRTAFRSLFDRLTHDAYWFEIVRAEHFDFIDAPWLAPSPDSRRTRIALTLRAYVGSFFNKYLKEIDDHLLDNPSSDYPDVTGYEKK